jgi:protein SCO1/2
MKRVLWIFFGVAAIALISGALWTWQQTGLSRGGWEERYLEDLQVFGQLPQFALIERSGRRITKQDLTGRISVVNFIYTNCPDTCPLQSAQMRELQERYPQARELLLLSITVDPRRDTPEALSRYASRFHADPQRWFFLTGQKEEIYRLAQEGFRLGAAEIPQMQRPPSGATHAHSPRFVLVDRGAYIRGYYSADDKEAMARLRHDLEKLLRATG